MRSLVLPEDIWQCVASFVPYDDLAALISINRAWYNIALDARYREIHWDKVDVSMTRTLVRLRTPSVAARVRRLHVRAWFIEYLINKESQESPSYVESSKRWVSRHFRMPSTPPRVAPSASGKSSAARDIIESMTQAVRLMTQVTEYSFEWRDLSPTADTLRFLSAARSAFGVSLRKLTLHAQLDNFTSLLSTVDFDNLEELELSFDHDRNVSPHSANLLRNAIAPFVNHFRRSISGLLISSASKADLSPLLHELQEFPHLHKFVARFAFDAEHLSDPRGLVNILRLNSETLSSVEVGRAFAGTSDDTREPPSTWGAFSLALEDSRAVLSNLEALRIPALTTFDATLACLRRSGDTLTSLHLVDHFLRDDEVVALLQVFAHRPFDAGLQTLYVGLMNLTVETLDLLASRLPGLQDLNLVLASTTVQDIVHRDSSPSMFCVGLVAHFYHDWALHNIGVWEKRFIATPISSREEKALMEHIARCVPSIQTFKGEPKSVGVPCRYWDAS
ncbi:hypothetical protein C8F04DRAFT_1122284 [Mycena alexandri]|uniref:F-box domain-containing protein n=1 Tax=Mycena alexandri TaxID=1745969 RepID=A0AAD6SH26_9AGAR|nr:hypothetical protein C8F04DRAFT_1122284 [Mycena alexandri]